MKETGKIAGEQVPMPDTILNPNILIWDFPILHRQVNGKDLVYLDNASTTQKPEAVIEAITAHYSTQCSNVHRGVHKLSQLATEAYESARESVRRFINAEQSREIIFVRGTTEAINLVASSYAGHNFRAGDEIVITGMEHHSNIVPWQMLQERTGVVLRVVPLDDSGAVGLEAFESFINSRTRLVAVAHISNALGTLNPVREIVEICHRNGVPVLVDGAQATGHRPVDIQEIGCDFYAFSGHKMYGPTGIGVLYGKASLLEKMPPYQGGGDMIESVTFEKSVFQGIPQRFEAGTPDIAGAVGLAAAIDYLDGIGMPAVQEHEADLLDYATTALSAIPEVRLIGTADQKGGVLSFVIDGVHPHDAGTILDAHGVAVRAGHHCAQPAMDRFGVPATVRASLGVYNSRDDVDALVAGIGKVLEVFT